MDKGQLLYLSQADVASLGVTMAEIIELVEKAFLEKGEGRVEMPPSRAFTPALARAGDIQLEGRIAS